MPPLPGLRVVRSSIHGYGVVAARPFAPGEVVADVDGVPWHAAEQRDDTYSLVLDEGVMFDMVDQTRWINHSCDPNCDVEGGTERGRGPWARIVARRAIAPGEELTYDYAFSAALAEPCACGVATCRGWIVDEDELPQLRQRLSGYRPVVVRGHR